MARTPPAAAQETPDPSFERFANRDSRRDALWMIAQQLHELTAFLARGASKSGALKEDWLVGSKVDALRDQLYQAPIAHAAPALQPR
jgi:hypothetical protein